MIRNGHDPKRNPVMIPYLNEHMAQMAQLLGSKARSESARSPAADTFGALVRRFFWSLF